MSYEIKITIGDESVRFPIKNARSVHLAKYTLIYLVRRLSKITSKGIRAEILSWDWIQDGDCVSQDMEVLFSLNSKEYGNNKHKRYASNT